MVHIYGFVRKVRCTHLQLTYSFEKMALKYTLEIYPKYTVGRGGYISQVHFMGIFHTICGIIFLHCFGWNSSQHLAIYEDAQLAIIPCK